MLGRLGDPDTDFAGPLLFLASPASSYVTGQVALRRRRLVGVVKPDQMTVPSAPDRRTDPMNRPRRPDERHRPAAARLPGRAVRGGRPHLRMPAAGRPGRRARRARHGRAGARRGPRPPGWLVVHVRLAFDPTYVLRTNRLAALRRLRRPTQRCSPTPRRREIVADARADRRASPSSTRAASTRSSARRCARCWPPRASATWCSAASPPTWSSSRRRGTPRDTGLQVTVVEDMCAVFRPDFHDFAVAAHAAAVRHGHHRRRASSGAWCMSAHGTTTSSSSAAAIAGLSAALLRRRERRPGRAARPGDRGGDRRQHPLHRGLPADEVARRGRRRARARRWSTTSWATPTRA